MTFYVKLQYNCVKVERERQKMNEDLLHNRVCKELGITKQELADMLGLSIKTIFSWSDPSRISQSARVAMELMLKNKKLDDTFYKIREVGQILVNITKEDKA